MSPNTSGRNNAKIRRMLRRVVFLIISSSFLPLRLYLSGLSRFGWRRRKYQGAF